MDYEEHIKNLAYQQEVNTEDIQLISSIFDKSMMEVVQDFINKRIIMELAFRATLHLN
jgi:hypothetical protein